MLTQSAVLKLAHFRKTLFKCDIGLVHLTSKVISISGTVDRPLNNYNANYCKALTTVTFNRMGMLLDIPCNLESIRMSLAVTHQKHLQRKEKLDSEPEILKTPACHLYVASFLKCQINKSSLLDKHQTNSALCCACNLCTDYCVCVLKLISLIKRFIC